MRRGIASLAQELGTGCLALSRSGHHFESDLTMKRRVVGEVDGAHAPAAEQAFDPVAPEVGARRQNVVADVSHAESSQFAVVHSG